MGKTKKERIQNAISALGIERKSIYSVKEINQIVKESKCSMYEVMYFLRFC